MDSATARKISVDVDPGLVDDVSRRRIRKWLEKPAEFGEVRRFKVADLRSDTTYQRAVSERWVQALIRNFDPRLLGTITVGLRGGNMNLVDGQHRHYMAKLIGIDTLWGVALHTSSLREEARLFVELNKNRRVPMGQQLFAAKLVAGDEMAEDINELVRKAGFQFRDPNIFTLGAAQDTISAINMLEKIYKLGGRERVREVLVTLRKAWDGDADSLGKTMIGALGRFYTKNAISPTAAGKAFSAMDAYTILERGKRRAHRNQESQLDGVVAVLEGML